MQGNHLNEKHILMEAVVRKLCELVVGESAWVKGYINETAETLRLQEMGLLPGTRITVTRRGAAACPFEVRVRGYRLALRKEDADLLCLQT